MVCFCVGIQYADHPVCSLVQVIPFVIERMKSLLHASLLSQQLTRIDRRQDEKLGLDQSWFTPNSGTNYDRNVFRNKLKTLLRFDPGIKLANLNLVEALTQKNTEDCFNMERLEVLGDMFLKYHTSMFLYNTVNADETTLVTRMRIFEALM